MGVGGGLKCNDWAGRTDKKKRDQMRKSRSKMFENV